MNLKPTRMEVEPKVDAPGVIERAAIDYPAVAGWEEKYMAMPKEEYVELLRERLGKDTRKASHEEVYAILERFLHDTVAGGRFELPKYPVEEVQGYQLLDLFDVYDSSDKLKKEDKWKLDKAYMLIWGITKKYPRQAYILHEWTNSIFEFVSPEVFLKQYCELRTDSEVYTMYSSKILSQLEYNMSYCGTEKFGKAFVDSMNFENRDQFGNTMALLDLISSVYNLASSGSYSSEYKVIDTIKNTLDKAFSEKKGSYLLHRKTEQILDQIENHSFVNMKEEIFEIQKGVWCLPSSEGLKLSKKENNDNIEKIQAEIKVLRQHLTPPQHLIDEAIKNGQQYVEWTPDRRTIMKYRQLGDDLLVYFTEPLKVDDLVMQSSGDTTVNLYEFQFMLSAQMRKKIESDFGISISDLSMPEQYQLLDYIRNMTFAEVESVVSFTKKFGRDAFRTFLSLESGGRDMGDKILILGDETKFPRPLAEKLFNKYGSFVDSANNIQEGISHLLGNKGTLDTSKISEKLLVRAKNLLVEYADKAQQGEVDEQRMDEDLDHIHQEIAVLGYAYIEMARQGDYTDLEDLGKVNVAVRTSSEYSEKEKEELEKVYEYSRPKETFENPEHIRLLRKEFRESLDREDVTVFEVDLDNKKIAFALLYYKDPKTLHMGGLSFHPDARNPAVGLAVMESMAKNLGNYTIEAEVHSENKILAMYTNRFGFTIVGEEPREKNAGELYYMIRREPTADKTAPIE